MSGKSLPLLAIATRNRGKLREFKRLLGGVPFKLTALDDLGVDFDAEETGDTFELNACSKSRDYAAATGVLTLADDSGLEVDALGGAPGVYSARYAGVHGDDEANNDLLLAKLANTEVGSRSARYRIVIALTDPATMDTVTAEGTCEGEIGFERRGVNGFGYDPLFYVPQHHRTMAELTPEEKDALSHRGIAARKLAEILRQWGN
ncbi:MAG: XTP/dITP diphosphatase [Chloroflexi bacterium]|nr:XTP/dITP diphosphatase [Chloroflexota bacterium]